MLHFWLRATRHRTASESKATQAKVAGCFRKGPPCFGRRDVAGSGTAWPRWLLYVEGFPQLHTQVEKSLASCRAAAAEPDRPCRAGRAGR